MHEQHTHVHVHWVSSIFTSRPVCDIRLFAAKGVVVQSCMHSLRDWSQRESES